MLNSDWCVNVCLAVIVGGLIGIWPWMFIMAMPFMNDVGSGAEMIVVLLCCAFGGGVALAKKCVAE